MKHKIFLYYLVLIIIGVSITGFFTSQLTRKFYMHEVEEKLKSTAKLIHYQILEERSQDIKIDYVLTAKKYAALLSQSAQKNVTRENSHTRITFIDFKGVVLGESDVNNVRGMENHSNRKEIQEAIRGQIGIDIRTSPTLKVNYLYVAIPDQDVGIITRVSVPLVQIKNIDRIMWAYTIIGILSGLALTTLLALRFSHSVTEPIKQLIHVAQDISHGNYSKRVSVKSKDELGQLGDTFNEMAIQLERTVADLVGENMKVDSIMNSMINGIVAVDRNYKLILINSIARQMFNIGADSDVIGTKIIEVIRNNQINTYLHETIENNVSLGNEIVIGRPEDKVLRIYTNPIKSKDGADPNSGGIIFIQDITNIKKLEQIRTEFVSNVTHELKTPLTSIRGFIETLRNGAIDDPDVSHKFLEIIDIEAERLYMLINDILQLSEIESKQKDTNIGTHHLKGIIDQTVSILEGVADKKGITLSSDINQNLVIVANKDRIKQMLINLIENGIKYNRENGSVSIKAYKEAGKIVISIKDTGIGIAEEHLPRIFERFYRVDKGRSRNMGGTGLGLSIVKHIVNLYNGDIKVNSELGHGTEFIIRLPA